MHIKMHAAIWATLCLAASQASASAADYRYTMIRVPGSSTTSGRGLNASGTVFGDYTYRNEFHCFMYQAGTITTVEPPGSTSCTAAGISNDNTVVGTFQANHTGPFNGFSYKNGVFTIYGHAGYETEIFAISPGGVGIGSSTSERTNLSQIFEIQGGAKKNQVTATNINQFFNGVNDSGTAVGHDQPKGPPNFSGLIDRAGKLSVFKIAGGMNVDPLGINASGVTVGGYTDAVTLASASFVDRNGVISPLSGPDGPALSAQGINDAGDIVGASNTNGTAPIRPFVNHAGSVTILDPPGAPPSVDVYGGPINNAGQVLGSYFLDDGEVYVSFLATPIK